MCIEEGAVKKSHKKQAVPEGTVYHAKRMALQKAA